MPSPFPGMDPFIESPLIFPDFHDAMIGLLREAINAKLPEPYFASIKRRTWVELSKRFVEPDVEVLQNPARSGETPAASNDSPALAGTTAVLSGPATFDVPIPVEEHNETYLEIRRGLEKSNLVTSIEILSRANKTSGAKGRRLYRRKQNEMLRGGVNLVEIDLLRGGKHTTAVPLTAALPLTGPFTYHICIRHAGADTNCRLTAIQLPQRLPPLEVPLRPGVAPVSVDLQALLDHAYETGLYHRQIDYRAAVPKPPLPPPLADWVQQLLRGKGLLAGE